MSRVFRRLGWSALALVVAVLLTSHQPLRQLAQSTWTRASQWLASGGALASPEADDDSRAATEETTLAESPNIASYGITPGDPARAEISATTGQDPSSSEPPSIRLSPEAAHSLMEERRRELDCELVLSAMAPKALAKRERKWRWLPAHVAQAERQALKDAAGRLGRGCPRWKDDTDDLKRRQAQRQANLSAAAAAGDLAARVAPVRSPTPQMIEQMRISMYDALLSGDPALIAALGWADQMRGIGFNRSVREEIVDRELLWTLVACDLGLDCLPGSPTLDRNCLRSEGICGSPNLHAAVQLLYPEFVVNLLYQQRDELLQRIRSGQIAGLFDPPPNPPPGGGP